MTRRYCDYCKAPNPYYRLTLAPNSIGTVRAFDVCDACWNVARRAMEARLVKDIPA